MFERYLEREALIVGPGTKTGMPILLENPHELGPDRLVNAVAGYELCGDACVVVDFGTAINYDVVSSAGRVSGRDHRPGHRDLDRGAHVARRPAHQGGHRRAAVADRQVDRGRGPVGDRVRVRRPGGRHLRRSCGPSSATSVTTIATGGMASVIVGFTESIDLVDDLLTLKGLRLVYERNR